MRVLRLSVAAALAVSAAVIGVTTAGAATATATATVVSLEQSQASLNDPPSLSNPTVTLDGSLAGAHTSVPIATTEPVTITEQVAGTGPAVVVATTTTDASGSFAVTVSKLTATGNFVASFAGDTANGYAASTSDVVVPFSNPTPGPAVAFTSVPKPQVAPGTSVTFAGKASVDVNGSKLPPPDATATLYRNGVPSGVTARLSATGTFALSFKPTGKNSWFVQVAEAVPGTYALYQGSASKPLVIDAVNVYRSRVETFTVPATHEVHSPVKVTGTVQAETGTAWKPAAGLTVAYYYRILPKGNWVHVANGKTNSRGAFGWQSGLVKFGHLQWQVRVAQQQLGSAIYQASTSVTRDSHYVDRTYITHVVAMHLFGDTGVAAIMQDYPETGGSGPSYLTVTGTAKFYYLPKGGKSWRYLGSGRANSSTNPSVEVAGTLDGHFRIVFPAQGNFAGSSATTSLS
jgi:hypothetical protein